MACETCNEYSNSYKPNTCDDCHKPFADCRCGAESVCIPHVISLNYVIANNVRKQREAQGMSQADLAIACSLQTSAISHIECGRRTPTIITLKKIAKRLGVSLDSLCEEAQ